MNNEDKRETPRVEYDSKVQLTAGEISDLPCKIINISIGGILLETNEVELIGKSQECTILIQALNGKAFEVKGMISRIEGNSVAIQFQEISSEIFDAICQISDEADKFL